MTRLILLILLVAIGLSSCSDTEYKKAEGAVWGTTYRIVYNSDKDLSDSIITEMRKVELSLSMFDKSSRVSQINARETNVADPYLKSVLLTSFRVNLASEGKFDPTVAPLVDLWGFGRDGRDTPIPDSQQVAEALSKVGLNKVKLIGDYVYLPKGMEFDFSAIAKGFGVDCVAAMLRRNGCKNYMIEIGGEVSVSGVNTYGEDWRIMIESPQGDMPDENACVLQITDCAVATSGNYRNNRMITSDSVVGHTINPHTGYPMSTCVLSATVVAPSCVLADAIATALMATEPDSAKYVVSRFPSTRAMLYLNKDGACTMVTIP